MPAYDPAPASADESVGDYDDMVLMDKLTPDTILDNVSRRYHKDKIYTNVSSILVAVNPYHQLPLYNTKSLQYYHSLPAASVTQPPPHIYALAHSAYLRALGRHSSLPPQSQSILISGESGAGKTETTKHILTYLAHASASSTATTSRTTGKPTTASSSTLSSAFSAQLAASVTANIEQRLLQCNPILEAFGNAKTLRNNNSSRFGKYITITLDRATGHITAASVRHYLLEANRVISQGSGERNYGIFYQLVAKLRLKVGQFRYLCGSGCEVIEGVDDREMYDVTTHALAILGLSSETIQQIFDIVLAVLQLGNITFVPAAVQAGKESCAVEAGKAEAALKEAARLLTLSEAQLRAVLLTKVIVSPRSTIINTPRSVEEAEQTRDTLARTLYAALMSYLVDRINDALNPNPTPASSPPTPTVSIGILDIFGFECFPTNSLEQLLINYANEKLHQHFLSYVFKLELSLYQQEGLLSTADPFTFTDNASTVELLDKRPTGLFPLLTDEVFVPKGNDASLLQKINTAHASHPQYAKPKVGRASVVGGGVEGGEGRFGVVHYAGSVEYGVKGMVDKNRSKVSDQLMILFEGARGEVMKRMFNVEEEDGEDDSPGAVSAVAAAAAAAGGDGKKAAPRPSMNASKATVCSLFQQSLSDLLSSISATHSHFVRCIKPNAEKLSYTVDEQLLRTQLQSSGVMDAVRVRKEGWGERMPLREFVQRYGRLATKQLRDRGMQRASDADKADVIVAVARGSHPALQSVQPSSLYALGKTKLFYKSSVHTALEAMLEKYRVAAAVLIQKRVRGWLVRTRQQAMKRVWKSLKAALEKGDLAQVDTLLAQLKPIESSVPANLLTAVQQQRNQLSAGTKASKALVQALTMPLSSIHDRLGLLDTALAMAGKVPAGQYASWYPMLAKAREVGAEVKNVLTTLQAQLEAIKGKLLVDEASAGQLTELLQRSSTAISASVGRLSVNTQSPSSLTALTEVSSVQSLALRLRRIADQLTEAINNRDLPALHTALEDADKAGLRWPILQEGRLCHQALATAADVDAALEVWTEQSITTIIQTLTDLLTSTSTPTTPNTSHLDRFLPDGVSIASLIALLEASLVAVQSEMEAESAAERALGQKDTTGERHFKLTMAIQRAEDALYMREHSRRTVTGRLIQNSPSKQPPAPQQPVAPAAVTPAIAPARKALLGKPGGTMGRKLEDLVHEMKQECGKLERLQKDTRAREEKQQAAVDALRAAQSSSSTDTIQEAMTLGEEAQVSRELLDSARSHLLTVKTIEVLTGAIESRSVQELRDAIDLSNSRLKAQALDIRGRAYHDTHQHAQAVLNMMVAVEKVREREADATRTRRAIDAKRKKRAAAGVVGGEEADREEATWSAAIEGLREVVAASRLLGAKDADIGVALQYVHEWDELHPRLKDASEVAEEQEKAAEEEAKELEKQRIIDRLKPQLNGGVRVMLPMGALPRRPSEIAATPPRRPSEIAAATPPRRRTNEPAEHVMGTPQSNSEEAKVAAEQIEKKRKADERRARLLREEAEFQEEQAKAQRALPPKPVSPRVKPSPAVRRPPVVSPTPSPPTAHTRTEYHYPLPQLPSLDRPSVAELEGEGGGGSRRVSGSTGQIMPLVGGSSSAAPSTRGSVVGSVEASVMVQESEWPVKAGKGQSSKDIASSPSSLQRPGRSLGDALHDVEPPPIAKGAALQTAADNGEHRANKDMEPMQLDPEESAGCCCVIS